MKKNKKSMDKNVILGLVISILFLIIFSFVTLKFFHLTKSENTIASCVESFNVIPNNLNYFEKDGNFNLAFRKIISSTCPYEEITLNNKNYQKIYETLNNCWEKTYHGKNIFSKFSYGVNLCLLCGIINVNFNDNNFNTGFTNYLKERGYKFDSKNSLSLNNYTIENKNFLPNKVKKGDKLIIIFYEKYLNNNNNKKNTFTSVKNSYNPSIFKKIISNILGSGIFNVLKTIDNLLTSNNGKIISFMIIQDIPKNNNLDFSQSKNLQTQLNKKIIVNCGENFIIPEKE